MKYKKYKILYVQGKNIKNFTGIFFIVVTYDFRVVFNDISRKYKYRTEKRASNKKYTITYNLVFGTQHTSRLPNRSLIKIEKKKKIFVTKINCLLHSESKKKKKKIQIRKILWI